jgi:hypothetical protein
VEHRIVQVGSQYMFADFEDGLYRVRTGEATKDGTPDTSSSRNPRSLLNTVTSQDLYSSAGAAESAFRETHRDDPVWDVYEEAPPDTQYVSLNDASRELGVDPATLRNQIHNRRLRGFKIGRNWVITSDEMERYRRENMGTVGRRGSS